MSVAPGVVLAGADLLMERSTLLVQSTVVVTVALVLFPAFGSVEDVETVAWFAMLELHVAVEGTVNAILRVLLWPFASVMLLHSTFAPFTAQLPSDAPLLNVSPDGMGFAILTVCAVPGPALLTIMVYVRVVPGCTELGPVFVMERSASLLQVMLVETVLLLLLVLFGSAEMGEAAVA